MRKKKVLLQGTAQSLQNFFADAVSRDFEILGIIGDEKISVRGLEVFTPQNLPKLVYKLIDGIIFTDTATHEEFAKFFGRGIFSG